MRDGERARRQDPERTAPRRSFSGLYQEPRPWRADEATQSADASSGNGDEVVARGVELGYRVIEDYLRQGQQFAERIGKTPAQPGGSADDVQEFSQRWMRYSSDFVDLWLDFLSSMTSFASRLGREGGSTAPPDSAARQGGHNGWQRPAGIDAPEEVPVSIEVASSIVARVTLDLRPGSTRRSLATHGLRAADPQRPPLEDVSFTPETTSSPANLRISVPAEQPPDIYTGVLFDGDTGEARGTLSVRLIA